jgi:hypothetical protein
MTQFEAIADRLQRGEISPDEADAESKLVQASLESEMLANISATISKRRIARGRRRVLIMVVLAALILLALYIRYSNAA